MRSGEQKKEDVLPAKILICEDLGCIAADSGRDESF